MVVKALDWLVWWSAGSPPQILIPDVLIAKGSSKASPEVWLHTRGKVKATGTVP